MVDTVIHGRCGSTRSENLSRMVRPRSGGRCPPSAWTDDARIDHASSFPRPPTFSDRNPNRDGQASQSKGVSREDDEVARAVGDGGIGLPGEGTTGVWQQVVHDRLVAAGQRIDRDGDRCEGSERGISLAMLVSRNWWHRCHFEGASSALSSVSYGRMER